MEMLPTQQHFRIKIAALKAHLIRRLGPGLSKQYLYYLNKLLSLKISKFEFNKICCRILGRKNIAFHNHFIRSILKNAYSAKDPPPSHFNDDVNDVTTFGSKETPTDLCLRNATSRASHSQGFSNGDMLPLSLRRARTGYCDQSSEDLHCALRANQKTNLSSHHFRGKELSNQSGDFGIPADVQGLVQQHEKSMTYAANDRTVSAEEKGVLNERAVSVDNKNQIEGSVKQEGNEVNARNRLRAPLGFVFFSDTAMNSGLLLDKLTLRDRMEQIAALQGLEGLSTDSVSILNNGLNAYLKDLISSCVKLVSARSELVAPSKLANGVVSLQDFRVAMELNPQQLGKDWPSLLEKICLHSYDGNCH